MGTPTRSRSEKEEEVREEYLETLRDLTFNSKPLIDVLTNIAEEAKAYASTIVDCIVEQLEKVADPLKLPILYLIDSIIKRVRNEYMDLFCRYIPRSFTNVYRQGDETVRQKLLKLRFTWNNLLPLAVLSHLDKMVQTINPNWPAAPSVHVNPKFVAISTNVTNANGVMTTRIAPVSSELINAVKRVRDPRLRKIELQEQNKPVNTNNSLSATTKEVKMPPPASTTSSSVAQIDAKIDQKNDRRLQLEKKKVPASKVEPKEPVKKRIAVKVIGLSDKSSSRNSNSSTTSTATGSSNTNGSSRSSSVPKAKTNKVESTTKVKSSSTGSGASTKPSTTKAIENSKDFGEILKDVMKRSELDGNKDKKTERHKLSKEQRDKGLEAIAVELKHHPEVDSLLAAMAERYPKIVPMLINIMERCKGDFADDDKKSSTVKKSSSRASSSTAKSAGGSTKRDRNTSPKPKSKTSSSSAAPAKNTSSASTSISVPKSTAQIPLPPTPIPVSATSVQTIVPIATTTASTVATTITDPSPAPITVSPIISSIPIPAGIPISVDPVVSTVASAILPSGSIATLADKLIPATLQTISVTTSITSTSAPVSVSSPVSSSAASVISPVPVPVSVPSPALPIPPPAPIISSTAAAAEQNKTQDVDYRQIFGFQILPVPAIVADDEPKSVIEVESEDDEIIDVDALPSKPSVTSTAPVATLTSSTNKPQKRKSQSKKHHSDRKKRRTSSSSNDSDASKCSVDSVTAGNKRSISETIKIIEEEGSRSPETDAKKAKIDDSFYSQTATANVVSNDEKTSSSNLIIMSVSESSLPKTDSQPMFSKFNSNFGVNFAGDNELTNSQNAPEIPPTDMNLVDMINEDPVRSINIDGVSREIRHYGSTAIVFMNWDDPRDIYFFDEVNAVRNVIIDDKFGIPCTLNAPEIETLVYGVKHRFRLGVPTRELYVNGHGHECYFGGRPIRIRLNYKHNYIKLEGPPPPVKIGTVKRLDIVAGKIFIIIDDQYKHPIYLDAKPQYFLIDKKPITLMFMDSLKRVLINNVPFRTDFGGPAQSFKIMGKVYQFRFTVLPHGIMPGINLSQMVVSKLPSPPPLPPQFQISVSENLPTPPMLPAALAPAIGLESLLVTNNAPSAPSCDNSIPENINIDELYQRLVASGFVPNVENENEVKHVDFKKPETLKQKQPALIKMLYSGTQCGNCGLRFPAEQTDEYGHHLDWHFRLNRKGKDGARTIHSRKWYYSRNDWIKFQEMEDNTDRGTSWFDNHPVTEYTEEVLEDVPCIPAGSNQNAACELCRDRFEQFYNDESDEWQLKNALKVDDLIYHPICYNDHQQKLEQEKSKEIEEEKPSEEAASPTPISPPPSATVAVDEDEKPISKEESIDQPSVDYDDDSDIEEVQLIEQPIEEIIINDENDFDEPNLETLNTEDIIAAQQEIAVEELPDEVPRPIKIEEPDDDKIVDISDTAVEPSYDEFVETVVDSPQAKSGPEGVVTMDGNIELMDSPALLPNGPTKIKINISKNIIDDRVHSPRNEETKNTVNEDSSKGADTENMYPIVSSTSDIEKLVPVDLKSRIKEAKLKVYPAVTKGTEKSGLCTIM